MKSYKYKILISFLACLFFVFSSIAQNEKPKPHKTRVNVSHLKNTHGDKLLSAKLSSRINKKFTLLKDLEIEFFVLTDTSEQKLGSEFTDQSGIATVLVTGDLSNFRDTAGFYSFEARFNGNDTLKRTSNDIQLKDAVMTMKLSVDKDSLKQLQIMAYGINGSGEKVAIKEAEVYIYIQRLFGLLKITDDDLEDGIFKYEFDEDFEIPGDVDNNIMVVGRIEDSDDYGTIETAQQIEWGTPITISEGKVFIKSPVFRYSVLTIILFIPVMLLLFQIYKYLKLGKIIS